MAVGRSEYTRGVGPASAWPALIRLMVLAAAAAASLATSKTLRGKRLRGPKSSFPAELRLDGELRVWLRENVNNQGCFAKQRLDFVADLPVRHLGGALVRLDPERIELRIDGARYPIGVARFVPAPKGGRGSASPPVRGLDRPGHILRAGQRARIYLRAAAILPVKALGRVRQIRLGILTSGGWIRLNFQHLRKLPIARVR